MIFLTSPETVSANCWQPARSKGCVDWRYAGWWFQWSQVSSQILVYILWWCWLANMLMCCQGWSSRVWRVASYTPFFPSWVFVHLCCATCFYFNISSQCFIIATNWLVLHVLYSLTNWQKIEHIFSVQGSTVITIRKILHSTSHLLTEILDQLLDCLHFRHHYILTIQKIKLDAQSSHHSIQLP